MIPKPLFAKTLLSFSFSSSQFRHSLLLYHLSTGIHSHSSSTSSSRRHDEESKNVRVSVWWDFENCNLPAGANVFKVATLITAALRTNGIKGPVQITAFGDMLQLSRSKQEALSATGINLTHIPQDSAPSVLCSAASIMWNWKTLVRGEDLNGRHFNLPPDGFYGSWYGHAKVTLQDPFSNIEQPTCSQGEELSESISEPKLRLIPKAVLKKIRHILSSCPKEGILLSELRSELERSNVVLDKDLYGYKKFSHFLLSLRHILKIQKNKSGQLVVHRANVKAPEPFESDASMAIGFTENGNQYLNEGSKLNAETFSGPMETNSLSFQGKNVEDPLQNAEATEESRTSQNKSTKLNVEQPLGKMDQSSDVSENVHRVTDPKRTNIHLAPVKQEESASKIRLVKNIWRRWFGNTDDCSGVKIGEVTRNSHAAREISDKIKDVSEQKKVEKYVKSPTQDVDLEHLVACSSYNTGSNREKESDINIATLAETPKERPGLFARIVNRCKFWRNSSDFSIPSDPPIQQIKTSSAKHDMFYEDSFWREMESFIYTQKGSLIISQSMTRKEMALTMQKEGPLVLKSLSESDVVRLVDILIAEKRWVEEYPTKASPFKLASSDEKNTASDDSCRLNGLSSLFSSKQSQRNRAAEQYEDEKNQNITNAGVSLGSARKRHQEIYRTKLLEDCYKLVKEVLRDYPEGYNIGLFRKSFVDRYGYNIDIEKLGYSKLSSLLQTIPGVYVDSTYMMPSNKVPNISTLDTAVPDCQDSNPSYNLKHFDRESSDEAKKEVESDSPWEELGPVDSSSSSRRGQNSLLKRKATEEKLQDDFPGYESSLSDDELTESDRESSTMAGSTGHARCGVNVDDSSLLQILDSWHDSKKGDNGKEKSENVEGLVDCSTNHLRTSDSSGLGNTVGTPLENFGRSQKTYSFVSDPVEDKLMEGILGSLKKAEESRVHN
ncbi:hypothetical protein K2173_014831 [Erythroxylum novogranatense]|uniref:HTH OST-type domain-containing protein n=1 Tax=Erythroxylum novogranatense TaxID=1862640 RepID=A0AAV8THP9_9ROSI|nr:hypothetical protein K2173_014831 [Erythroxylum novogranatense]